jgi:hypothetical protein
VKSCPLRSKSSRCGNSDREEEEVVTRFLIWTAPLLAVIAPVSAQTPSADAAAAPAKPDKICRTFPVTGQRLTQSKCYTAAQWEAYDRASNEAAKKLISEVTKAGPGGGLTTSSIFGFGQQ